MFASSMPRVDARFWAALGFASICGINLGDLLPDNFHFSPLLALAVLAAAFAALAVAHGLIKGQVELLFWLAVVAVRAAATVLADLSASRLGLPGVSAALAILLLACVAVTGGFAQSEKAPAGGPIFWPMLLICGVLGTAAADWSGRSLFSSPKIGFPATAVIETILIAVGLLARHTAAGRAWGYWLMVLVICAWGASVGDIAKFLLSMPVSLGGSAILLALIALAWPSQGPPPTLGPDRGGGLLDQGKLR